MPASRPTPTPLPLPPGRASRAPGSRSAASASGAGPSDFYRQHHAVESPQIDATAFRPAWRVKTRLDKLAIEGAIDTRTYQAALGYRRVHDLAYAGLVGAVRLDGTGRAPRYGGSRLERSEAQLAAIEQLRRIERQLGGAVASKLVELIVIDDASWAKIGKQFGIDRKTGKAWVLVALQRLAEVG